MTKIFSSFHETFLTFLLNNHVNQELIHQATIFLRLDAKTFDFQVSVLFNE